MIQASTTSSTKVARKTRARALMFLVLALAAGGSAVFLVKRYLDRVQGVVLARSQTAAKVVVAAIDVPIATELTEAHLATIDWPVGHVPEGAFGVKEKVVGRTVRTSVVKGEAILEERLADQNMGRGLAAILADGTRAMTVKVDQVVGVAGFVQPGDFVDVITVMRPDDETKKGLGHEADRISKIILQNIKVLAIGEQMVSKGNQPVKVQVVTLEVNPEQTERLALASRHGEIQLTMRSRIDPAPVPTSGITPLALLAPDEGTEQKKATKAPEPQKAAGSGRPAAKSKTAAKSEKPEEEKGPVIEILRGDKVEERQLRPSADSQKQ